MLLPVQRAISATGNKARLHFLFEVQPAVPQSEFCFVFPTLQKLT
jgi:hypothetical protein